jgi:PhzF family phenazine biosynthesis protein
MEFKVSHPSFALGGAMKIPIYQVDAFTGAVFRGNPAAVCPLATWPEDELLQAIAAENNLSETAFLVAQDEHFELRWFTPRVEVDLCGHATLAAGYVVFHYLDIHLEQAEFETRSGRLRVRREGSLLAMDFPALGAQPCSAPEELVRALGAAPVDVLRGLDYMAVYDSEAQVRSLRPDFALLGRIDTRGVIVTAPGEKSDFVSRFFAPGVGIPEDPVTGSAHCALVPYWSEKLRKKEMHAFQVSARGGELICENLGDRVKISGEAVIFLEGVITV